jgi:hypothetical protein
VNKQESDVEQETSGQEEVRDKGITSAAAEAFCFNCGRIVRRVRVVGGFTEHQFAEKRLPTIDELNAVAPDTPVFLLHLYDRAILNAAALRAVGYARIRGTSPNYD